LVFFPIVVASALARPIWIVDLAGPRGVVWITLARAFRISALGPLAFAGTILTTLTFTILVLLFFHCSSFRV
jgi:hypothetical protein